MDGSTFTGLLDMDSLEVGNHLFMRDGTFSEPIGMYFAKIGGAFTLSGTNLKSLDMSGAHITSEFQLGSEQHPAPKWEKDSLLTLRNATVGAVQDLQNAWPEKLNLEGFNYTRLGGLFSGKSDIASRESKWFINWLAKDQTYSPQPYQQLAIMLRASGHSDKSDDILYAGKERERVMDWGLRRLGFDLLNTSIGYGYGFRYFYSLIWIAVLVALGVLVLHVSGEGKRNHLSSGVAYSLDMLLPIIRLRECHYTDVDLAGSARYYFYFHIIMGYVLASFLVAGLAGLTK